MATIFLATKIEEKSRRLRDIVFVFHHLYRKRKFCMGQDVPLKNGLPIKDSRRAPMELGGYRYDEWKRKLVEMERHVLKELGFGFY